MSRNDMALGAGDIVVARQLDRAAAALEELRRRMTAAAADGRMQGHDLGR